MKLYHMIHPGDKFIFKGTLLEVKKASIDDNYIYVIWKAIGYMKIPLRYFLKKFISITSMVNINHFLEVNSKQEVLESITNSF